MDAPDPRLKIEQSAVMPVIGAMPWAFLVAPQVSQMSVRVRILSFGELKRLKHIAWNEEHIAQLVGAGLFPAPVHSGAWHESHIDNWLRARKAQGDLTWMRFSLKEMAG